MLKIKNGFVLRQVAGQYMAIPVGNRVNDLHGFVALNESGEYLWNHLTEERTVEDLILSLTSEYEVSEEDAREAVIEFLELLENNNLLEN